MSFALWVSVGACFGQTPSASMESDIVLALRDSTCDMGQTISSRPGPWGRMEYTSTLLEPPPSIVGEDVRSKRPLAWQFTGMTTGQVAALLMDAGLDPVIVDRLMNSRQMSSDPTDFLILPPDDILLGMEPETRRRVYFNLRASSLNKFYGLPFHMNHLYGDEWFRDASLSPATLAMLDRLVYRQGSMMYFSDVRFVLSKIDDVEERRNFFAALLRQVTLRVRLSIKDASEVDGLVAYWGAHGRENVVRPIIEAVERGSVDWPVSILSLLPPLPRERLFTYNSGSRELFRDCNWTALNFFNDPPDDIYLQQSAVTNAVFGRYAPIESNFLPGDLILLRNDRQDVIHMCNYIADNIVFTKNGGDLAQPWILSTLREVVDYYTIGGDAPDVLFLRERL